jgi:hypothetical protein
MNELIEQNGDKKNDSDERPSCFIIMPISDPDSYEKGHFKRVYENIFKPACALAGYKAVRADDVVNANLIHLDILRKILESPMAICDLSTRNPNVMFELGLRQAFDKPVVLVQEIGTPPIFDISPLRYTEYHREHIYESVLEDQKKIAEVIRETAKSGANDVNSIVRLLSLTQPAQLAQISEGERESGLLQTILAELNFLKTEIKRDQFERQKTFRNTVNAKSYALETAERDVRLTSFPGISVRAENLIEEIHQDIANARTERIEEHKEELFALYKLINSYSPATEKENNELNELKASLDGAEVLLQKFAEIILF